MLPRIHVIRNAVQMYSIRYTVVFCLARFLQLCNMLGLAHESSTLSLCRYTVVVDKILTDISLQLLSVFYSMDILSVIPLTV